ncbi:hypothetical protein D9M69_606690 [compost metagenome]
MLAIVGVTRRDAFKSQSGTRCTWTPSPCITVSPFARAEHSTCTSWPSRTIWVANADHLKALGVKSGVYEYVMMSIFMLAQMRGRRGIRSPKKTAVKVVLDRKATVRRR